MRGIQFIQRPRELLIFRLQFELELLDLLLYFKDVFDALLSLKVHALLKVRTSLSYDVFYLGVLFCYLVMNKFCCNLSSFSFDIQAVLDRLGRLKGVHYTIVHVLLLGLSILGLL